MLRLVLRVTGHPWLTLALAGVAVAACIALAASRLSLSTDQDKLFSSRVQFFRDWLDFTKRFPENEALYVLIEPADAAHVPKTSEWAALTDELARRLRGLDQYVKQVDEKVPLHELGRQGVLFEDPGKLKQELEDARRFLPLVKLWSEAPGTLQKLLGTTPMERFLTALATQRPDAETSKFVFALADSWMRTLRQPSTQPCLPDLAAMGADDPSTLGYYYVADESDASRRLLLVKVFLRESYSDLTSLSAQFARSAARRWMPRSHFPSSVLASPGGRRSMPMRCA